MAYYHSFAWEHMQARRSIATLQADGSCGMAHWARALASLDNPFVWPGNVSAEDACRRRRAAWSRRARPGSPPQRERDYVDALAAFFQDADKLNHRTPAKALETALREVAAKYPDDTEATILYSLVLSANFDPADKQYGNQLQCRDAARADLREAARTSGRRALPDPQLRLPAAGGARTGGCAALQQDRAGGSARAAHAVAHLHARRRLDRFGRAPNCASAKADTASGAEHAACLRLHGLRPPADGPGPRGAGACATSASRSPTPPDHFAAAYAYAAIPARLALERGDWAAAAALPLTPAAGAYPWAKYPQAEASNAYARAPGCRGTARRGGGRAELARLQRLRDQATELKFGYWVEQIGIQIDVVRGFATFKAGQSRRRHRRAAPGGRPRGCQREARVTPGPCCRHARFCASRCWNSGDAAGALREFEAVLRKEPNRLRAMAGAAMAAERGGDAQKARDYTAKMSRQTAQADGGALGVRLARQW